MSNVLSLAGKASRYKNENSKHAGFLAGLWHGLLMPLVFIISLFNANINIYETNNNDKWYHFGLVIGIYAIAGNTFNIYVGNTVF